MPLNPSDAARYGLDTQPKRSAGSGLIERCDELISIIDVLEQMGCDVPRGEYSSWKMHCPFGYEHPDGGIDKNFRAYPPSNVNCFAMHGFLTPSSLYARWKGLSRERSAKILLEEAGLLKYQNYREKWNELADEREAAREANTALGSTADLVKALQQALHRNLNYKAAEFSPGVREAWRVVLTALDVLWSRSDTDRAKLQVWFERSLLKINNAVMEAGL
jgi:hypothetical protein